MDISIFSWNVQGCGHQRFIPAAKQFLRDYKPDIVLMVEPRVSGLRAERFIAAMGFPHSHRVEAVGFAGGIWIAWWDTVALDIIINHFQFVHFRVTVKKSGFSFLSTAIYGSPCSTKRKRLWANLHRLATTTRSPWILFGDFNTTLLDNERKGCAASSKPSPAFKDLLYDHGLRDMGYSGLDYTWTRDNAYVRLDRFICNSYWDSEFHDSHVEHLLRVGSDHRPILLSVGPPTRKSCPSSFRYFSGWQQHPHFPRLIRDNWQPSTSLADSLSTLSKAVEIWNKNVFGSIGARKRIIMARLRGVQKALSTRASTCLRRLEADLLCELEHWLDQEELLWKQKSQAD
ncbi:hypothetical protein HRI_001414000 [Hibiscus trionum]|uniref:Endonuclease/exonuclease/phosphatase domain-containing protein n=1 Tax=Hibiscus trionum TaxID=183268 RepID=A0A9W7LTZ1_HIBTR|nr:hypothetical protein HRI_001414000 [Hibiscus trionum]